MRTKFVSTLLAAASLLWAPSAHAGKIHGKIDAGPVYVHMDVLQHGETFNKMDMEGFKVTSTFIVWLGLCVKPNIMVAYNDGRMFNYGCAVGWLIPMFDMKVTITPTIGGSLGYLRTTTVFPALVDIPLKQQFNSKSWFVGVDGSFSPHPKWTIGWQVNRAWSNSNTTITIPGVMVMKTKGESKGMEYGASLDYWFKKQWSVQAAFGWSNAKAKEKNGMRGYGGRLGIGYFF